jgi:hypothetical protein
MIAATPTRQINAPAMSYRSDLKPSSAVPQAREPRHKHTAVGGEDAPKVCIGLQGCHEAVGAERDDAASYPKQASVFADPLPDQPGSADLGERGRGVRVIEREVSMRGSCQAAIGAGRLRAAARVATAAAQRWRTNARAANVATVAASSSS